MEPEPMASAAGQLAIDPVCGMRVDSVASRHISEHEGVTYHFCGKGCRLDFEDDPQRYLAPDHRPSMEGH